MVYTMGAKKGDGAMTLIEVRSIDGTLIGRCDARCYNAQHPKCTCVCGGKNHGRSVHQAAGNMANDSFVAAMLRQWESSDMNVSVKKPTEDDIEREMKRARRPILEKPRPLRGAQYMRSLWGSLEGGI